MSVKGPSPRVHELSAAETRLTEMLALSSSFAEASSTVSEPRTSIFPREAFEIVLLQDLGVNMTFVTPSTI